MDENTIGILIFILLALAAYILSGVKIIRQYERAVVFTLGRFKSIRDPGIRLILPVLQRGSKIDTRSTPVEVSSQEVITKDNVTITIDAVVYFRVKDSAQAVLNTTNYRLATSQFAQAALRDVVGNADLDNLLSKREKISQEIKRAVDSQTEQWGVDVEHVKIQNIELPENMQRAMAKQAEAERIRRAAIITADGEKAAAQKVAEAAKLLSASRGGISVRTLQTLEKISSEPSQKTMVLMPSELTDIVKTFSGNK